MAALVAAGSRTAVLADRQGFVVATSGEQELQERLAAFSALLDDVAHRAESLLPLGAVEWVRLVAKNRMEIACRRFGCGEEPLTLCTIGMASLEPHQVDRVLSDVASKALPPSAQLET
jgi:long-subunit acyl-CoA synthetase (AMP-forming)